MDIERQKAIVSAQDGLSKTLGMEFLSTPEPDTVMARMKVSDNNKQPFGFLSGGASLALAENLAGVGSMALCPGHICVGISVNGHHVKAVAYGGTVTALARIQHKGRTLHEWHVDITDDNGDLISTVQVTNYVLTPRTPKETKQQ